MTHQDPNAAPITLRGKVLLVDYGEVISRDLDPRSRDELEALSGLDPAAFWPTYWAHRTDLDAGRYDVEGYWQAIAADHGVAWSLSRVQCLWSADLRGWLRIEPGTVDLLERLALGGTRLALLSNAGRDYGSAFRHSPMGRLFEATFVSGELGQVKPAPELFRRVAADLGVDPADVVFVDNRADNVEGALAVGMSGHVFVGVAELESFLLGLAAAA